MFEREIKFIYDFNLNRIKKSGSFLTFEQLVELEIHPAILKYISAEIDFLIFEDRQKLLQDSVFDYSGEEVSGYFNQIDAEIKKSKKLSIEYIDKLLLHAISFSVNFLVRPRWTLSRFLFDKDEVKSKVEVKQIINYVYFYNYLTDTLVSYLDKKKLVSVKQTDIDELIKKIDDFAVESYLANIISTAINSMAEFFNIGSVQQNKIQLVAIKLFLQEKNLDDHLKKLENTFSQEDKVKFTATDVLRALSSEELIFNLKSMETEQIEEAELEGKESFEFESVDEFEDNTLSEHREEPIEQQTETDSENSVSQKSDEFIEEDVEEEKLSILQANEDDNNEFEKEDDSESVNNNQTQDFSTENNNTEQLPDAEQNVIDESTISNDNIEIEKLSSNSDKFEFEKTIDEESDLINNLKNDADENFKEYSDNINVNNLEDHIESSEGKPDDIDNQQDKEKVTENNNIVQTNNIEIKNNDYLSIEEDIQFATENETIEETSTDKEELEEVISISNEDANMKTSAEEATLLNEREEDISENADTEFVEEANLNDTETEDNLNYSFEENIQNSIQNNNNDDNVSEEEEFEDDSSANNEIANSEPLPEEFSNAIENKDDQIEEIDAELIDDLNSNDDTMETSSNNVDLSADDEFDFEDTEQPELFSKEELNMQENELLQEAEELNVSEEIDEHQNESDEEKLEVSPQIELSDLLENKNMSKIIKTVFDYDMDDFVNTIESISECRNEEEAVKILEKIYHTNGVKDNSKEAKTLNSIISEYFEKK